VTHPHKDPEHRFTVEGAWPFPYDMLRYDCCYPASEQQSAIFEQLGRETTRAGVVTIELVARRRFAPTSARWESFCWKVVQGAQL
jgi:hypothetical protein